MFHYLQLYPQLLTGPESRPSPRTARFGAIVRPHRRHKAAAAGRTPAAPPRQPERTPRP